MLMPKRVKFRRVQRGRLTGKALRGNTISNGSYGLVATEPAPRGERRERRGERRQGDRRPGGDRRQGGERRNYNREGGNR